MKGHKVILVGGGIGGLTTALALHQRGWACEIVEASESIHEIGAGIQLSPNAMHVLNRLGLGKAIEAIAVEPTRAVIRNFRSGKVEQAIALKGMSEKLYGAKYLQLHRVDFIQALHEAIRTANIPIHFGERALSYEEDEGGITLHTSLTTRTASILIGADGIHSTIRAQLLGKLDKPPHFCRQVATRGLVLTKSLPPDTLAHFASSDIQMWLGPKRHFVAYPVRDGTQINFVAVESKKEWTKESWRTEGKKEEARESFFGWDKRIDDLLHASTSTFVWGLFDRKPLPHWHKGNAVLLGDACHPSLPFMAQGAAQAMEDAFTLAQNLAEKKNIKDAFTAYEKIRKPHTSRLQRLSRTNGRIYHLSNPLARACRRFFFQLSARLSQKPPRRLHKIYSKPLPKGSG